MNDIEKVKHLFVDVNERLPVEKIETLNFEIVICTWKTEIFSKDFPYKNEEFSHVDKTGKSKMIELCYKAVVEFIKWYNLQQK